MIHIMTLCICPKCRKTFKRNLKGYKYVGREPMWRYCKAHAYTSLTEFEPADEIPDTSDDNDKTVKDYMALTKVKTRIPKNVQDKINMGRWFEKMEGDRLKFYGGHVCKMGEDTFERMLLERA